MLLYYCQQNVLVCLSILSTHSETHLSEKEINTTLLQTVLKVLKGSTMAYVGLNK